MGAVFFVLPCQRDHATTDDDENVDEKSRPTPHLSLNDCNAPRSVSSCNRIVQIKQLSGLAI